MSHTTEIKQTQITDVDALFNAVKDLQADGIECELLQNTAPRMYSPQQFYNSTKKQNADLTLRLKNSRYDIGFVKRTETVDNQEITRYEPILDTWGGDIEKQCGYKQMPGQDSRSCMGKLLQYYGKHVAITNARSKGYNVRSAEFDENQNLQLVLASSY